MLETAIDTMMIKLILEPRGAALDVEIEKGTTAEELYNKYGEKLPYRILAARIDNELEPLSYEINKPCKVELLDMRHQGINLVYQDSLSLIYLKAIYDVLGDVDMDIENALNKGLYTDFKLAETLSQEDVEKIEARMRELVELNLPIEREVVSVEEARDIFIRSGQEEKIKLLIEEGEYKLGVPFYTLDGFKDFFYGMMVPSTGYIKEFQLMKYKRGVLLRFPHPTKPDEIPEYVDEKNIYKAFGEQSRWGKLMKINYVSDLNALIEKGKSKELIQLSEALHERRIVEIADMITEEKKRIILIAGPSSSGKTTFAQRLCIQLRVNGLDPLYLGTDDYFVERENTPLDENGEKNYEDLEAVDVELFNSHMNDLLEGKEVDIPKFDFITGHKEFGKRITSIRSNQPVVIEGIHALNGGLTPYIADDQKFKIYISPLTQLNIDSHNRVVTTDHRMLRRMVRDYKYRGHSAQNTIASWPKVRAGEDKNIFPYSNEADVMFNSVHLYEISVLKKYAEPLLRNISKEEPEYGEAVRMLNFLKYFKVIEDDRAIVNNSILREFIGGSIFVD